MSSVEQPPVRGRGTGSRGRSRSRTNRGARNYGSRTVQAEAAGETKRVETILQANAQRSQQAPPPNANKVAEYIEQGKTFVTKFFKGFQQEKRGNIEITIDDNLPERIAEPYYDRLHQHVSENPSIIGLTDLPRTRKVRRLIKRFTAGLTLATAIKLYKSSTELEKTANFNLNVLHHSKIHIPERAAVIINQLGKTDLKDDNRIRIVNQHMACKRMLVKSFCRFMSTRKADEYITEALANNLTIQHLYRNVFDDNVFPNMIDNTLKSLQILKEKGKQFFLEQVDRNYEVHVNSVSQAQVPNPAVDVAFQIRLPNFNFDEVTEDRVINYLNNPLFETGRNRNFNFTDHNVVVRVVCSLVFQIAKIGWIRNPNRAMNVIDQRFGNTFIADATFLEVMNAARIWNINNFITDSDLNEVLSMELHSWNSRDVHLFNQCIKFKEINFSDLGTDSQMVEISGADIDDQAQFSGVNRFHIKKKPKSTVHLKISETGAIFGVMAKFNRKVRITSDFTVNHDSNNRNLLREFLKADIYH
jgi:hypothetical protein